MSFGINTNQLKELNYQKIRTVRRLRKLRDEYIVTHPDLESTINDFYELAETEIENGGSVFHETELFIGSIEELIKNKQE